MLNVAVLWVVALRRRIRDGLAVIGALAVIGMVAALAYVFVFDGVTTRFTVRPAVH